MRGCLQVTQCCIVFVVLGNKKATTVSTNEIYFAGFAFSLFSVVYSQLQKKKSTSRWRRYLISNFKISIFVLYQNKTVRFLSPVHKYYWQLLHFVLTNKYSSQLTLYVNKIKIFLFSYFGLCIVHNQISGTNVRSFRHAHSLDTPPLKDKVGLYRDDDLIACKASPKETEKEKSAKYLKLMI